MKNKRGFTIVELLSVIVIIGILTIIAVPTVTSLNNKSKEKIKNTKITQIEQSFLLWAKDNEKCFTTGGINCLCNNITNSNIVECTVTYKELADFGIIKYDKDEEIIDPVDNSTMNNNTITIKYNKDNRTFEIGEWQ